MDLASTDWHAWFTLFVIIVTIVALLREFAQPELILIGALGLLLFAGVVEPGDAFKGFANPAVFTIGALYVVAAGVQRTEALRFLDKLLVSPSKSIPGTIFRLMGITAFLSAFLNNTPIVAMLVPRIQQWSAKSKIQASQLLIPLSYAAIIGGTITLIGTSTNIIVSELMVDAGYEGLSMFDLSWVGLPAAIAVLIYFALFGHRLLPSNNQQDEIFEDGLKKCLFELKVAENSELAGRSIEESGLRSLRNAYLAHIQRRDQIIPATPEKVLNSGDTLLFTGSVNVLQELLEMPGLVRGTEPVDSPQGGHMTLPLFEAVVSKSSHLVGKSLHDVRFRERYNGIVLGIQRQNETIKGGVGRVPLEAGDLLVIEAPNGFDKRWNENRENFYLVAPRTIVKKSVQRKAWVALTLMVLMVVAFTTGVIPLVTAAFVAALGMIVTRCVRGGEARRAINFQVLAVIGAALGIGEAVRISGLAQIAADQISLISVGMSSIAVIAVIYIATNFLTEMMTNQAAAILMLPIGLAVAIGAGIELEAVAVTISVAASASFMTPFGYQTNLMVMSAGGYRLKDYFKAGFPVSLIVMVVTITMVYIVWMQ